MFCRFCGNELSSDAQFCQRCGRAVEDINASDKSAELARTPIVCEALDKKDETARERDTLGSKILTNAIIGLAFASSFTFAIVGLVFSIISRCQIKDYVRKYSETEGCASVGKGVSIAGLVISILAVAYLVISVIFSVVMFIILLTGDSGYYYDPYMMSIFA